MPDLMERAVRPGKNASAFFDFFIIPWTCTSTDVLAGGSWQSFLAERCRETGKGAGGSSSLWNLKTSCQRILKKPSEAEEPAVLLLPDL
jgi:hypothetical protein